MVAVTLTWGQEGFFYYKSLRLLLHAALRLAILPDAGRIASSVPARHFLDRRRRVAYPVGMSKTNHTLTASFPAQDSNGVKYVIQVFTPTHSFGSSQGGGSVQGTASLFTDTGEEVNRLDKGKYETLSGVFLTSKDPDAV